MKQVEAMTCGEAVMKLLAAYEVDTVFGMAGTMTVGKPVAVGLATAPVFPSFFTGDGGSDNPASRSGRRIPGVWRSPRLDQ
jgi:hypothetical protein